MKKLFGVTTAMTTPFDSNGRVDVEAIKTMTNFLIEKGVHCLYPLGTTGEMMRLSVEERKLVAETVAATAAGRVVVYIQCGAMLQNEVIELVQHAEKIGADGVGVVTPVFFGLNNREMETFYETVAGSISKTFPLYLYNIPQCASNDIKPEVAQRLAQKCPNIVGIKYSFPDLDRTVDYLNINNGSFSVVLGPDFLFLQGLTMGCTGCVSGISSVYPEPFVGVYNAYKKGDIGEAERLQKIAIQYIRTLRGGSNMAYFKTAQEYRGLPGGHMRAPQLDLLDSEKEELIASLKEIDVY